MKFIKIPLVATVASIYFASNAASQDENPSQFDESIVRALQDSSPMPSAFQATVHDFESSSDHGVKAAKWEELVLAASENYLTSQWAEPSGGWKLIEFPSDELLTVAEVRQQPWRNSSFTKLVAQNEEEAVKLRGAGALMAVAASDGEQWGAGLLLDIASRPESNIKRLTYWFTSDFASDKGIIDWEIDWNEWQETYDESDPWGKAIILRNVTMLAVRRNEFSVAATINLSALSGANRELKAIALAFGNPALGAAVTARWAEIADDASDPQLQALAQEVRSKFGTND